MCVTPEFQTVRMSRWSNSSHQPPPPHLPTPRPTHPPTHAPTHHTPPHPTVRVRVFMRKLGSTIRPFFFYCFCSLFVKASFPQTLKVLKRQKGVKCFWVPSVTTSVLHWVVRAVPCA